MAQINVNNLTFGYEGSFDNVFEDVSFSIDTDWKLGFVGRNGKGKTTFLNILLEKYKYQGSITKSVLFDYFPYKLTEKQRRMCAADFIEEIKPGCEQWRVIVELERMSADAGILYRPFNTLSNGEQTKLLLAILFSGENEFLLIDEPTNHLDNDAKEIVKKYLTSKKGFILVSHDRDVLDTCADHMLVLNRKTIEVQKGNFSSWWENKTRKDNFAIMENEKHLREIASLKKAVESSKRWAQKNENTKIGFDTIKEHDRFISTRSYIGAKTKKMEKRVANYEKRMQWEIEEKEGLLQDIENPVELKIMPQKFHKERLVFARNLYVSYKHRFDFEHSDKTKGKAAHTTDIFKEDNISDNYVLKDISFEICEGERVFLEGGNGCGKSTLIKTILKSSYMFCEHFQSDNQPLINKEYDNKTASAKKNEQLNISGDIYVPQSLKISYISQETDFLSGSIDEFCKQRKIDKSLFLSILRQLDMDRNQFLKKIEDFSEGQKKKVLIAASLVTKAHLYIWDEPLNYIDVFSRIQIEDLLLRYKPTMIIVDHDKKFQEKIATKVVSM